MRPSPPLFGAFLIVTLFTQGRPGLFYVGRYLSAGRDPVKSAAYDTLHDLPAGRHSFRVLSVVWGIGLIVEATCRMVIADILPTGTFLAVSPFITAGVLGSLFGFTVIYAAACPDGGAHHPGRRRRRGRAGRTFVTRPSTR